MRCSSAAFPEYHGLAAYHAVIGGIISRYNASYARRRGGPPYCSDAHNVADLRAPRMLVDKAMRKPRNLER